MSNNKEKRNINPEDVYVLSVNALPKDETLDWKEDALVENRYNVFLRNLKYLQDKAGLNQGPMCGQLLEGRPQTSQLSAYKDVGKDIPYRIMARIAIAFGYTPEEMTGQILEQVDADGFDIHKIPPRPVEEYKKYQGTYSMAYFATDAKLGGNKRTTASAMANGVMSVFLGMPVGDVPTLEVVAFINCTDDEKETILNEVHEAERKRVKEVIRKCYERAANVREPGTDETPRRNCLYTGRMTLNDHIAEVTLKQESGSNVINLKMHNRVAISSDGRDYKGGLATMMSTSCGREQMPCIQAVILSKRSFAIAKEELAEKLLLAPPTVDLQDEIKPMVAYMKSLFFTDNFDDPVYQFSDADKMRAFEIFVERKLTEVIKRNIFGYYKVSRDMDSGLSETVCRDQ